MHRRLLQCRAMSSSQKLCVTLCNLQTCLGNHSHSTVCLIRRQLRQSVTNVLVPELNLLFLGSCKTLLLNSQPAGFLLHGTTSSSQTNRLHLVSSSLSKTCCVTSRTFSTRCKRFFALSNTFSTQSGASCAQSRIFSSQSRTFRAVSRKFWTQCRAYCAQPSPVKPTSVLFGKGSESAKAHQSPMQLKLNLAEKLSPKRVQALRDNLSARGLAFDLDQLLADYSRWRDLEQTKADLENERYTVAKSMATIVKDKSGKDRRAETKKLKSRGKALKEELRALMPVWWDLEEAVMTKALSLPTDLHPDCPIEDKELERFPGTFVSRGRNNHIDVAEKMNLIQFSNVGPRAAYLLGELAELELSLLHYATAAVTKQGFSPMTGSEIIRSLVVEGCGLDPSNKQEIFALHQKESEDIEVNRYHLKGNSLLSYAAYFTKQHLSRTRLPVKMCSAGRHYRPPSGADLPGLYGAIQSNRVTMFGACESGEAASQLHTDMTQLAWDTMHELGLPTRKVMKSVGSLSVAEGLRSQIEVWAPSQQRYVQVGHVSLHYDYVSCRLMSRCHPDGAPLHMVSGVAMDTAPVLASILEHSFTEESPSLLSIPCLATHS